MVRDARVLGIPFNTRVEALGQYTQEGTKNIKDSPKRLENAKKLIQVNQYSLNTQLGYISLNQRLQNDEILAVAFTCIE